ARRQNYLPVLKFRRRNTRRICRGNVRELRRSEVFAAPNLFKTSWYFFSHDCSFLLRHRAGGTRRQRPLACPYYGLIVVSNRNQTNVLVLPNTHPVRLIFEFWIRRRSTCNRRTGELDSARMQDVTTPIDQIAVAVQPLPPQLH